FHHFRADIAELLLREIEHWQHRRVLVRIARDDFVEFLQRFVRKLYSGHAFVTAVLTVALAADHVDHAECRHDVRYGVAPDHLAKRPHRDKTGRTHAHAVRLAAAVTHEVEAELAVAALDRLVHFAGWHLHALHDDLEMMHQPFDAVVNLFFVG